MQTRFTAPVFKPLGALLSISLAASALTGCSRVAASAQGKPNSKSVAPAKTPVAANANGLNSLCHNHYNKLRLSADGFGRVKAIMDADKAMSLTDLKTRLNSGGISLNEASWGLYYLGLKSIQNNDYSNYIRYMTIAADDYLNPWAMTKLSKVYYYDKSQWQKDFPNARITTDKDLTKSYLYLTLAFAIGGEIEQAHHDNMILTGVTSGGLALKDTFEGIGVAGFDARATLAKNRADLIAKLEMYKTMYEKGK